MDEYSVRLQEPLQSDLSVEKKAELIVRCLLEKAGSQVEYDRDGVDLKASCNGKTTRIEVKGTKAKDIAWNKLKVSSLKSYKALKSGSASMYRVVDVESKNLKIYVLEHGRDFRLEPEPRWSVKPANSRDQDRYPLRGIPYRYDRPSDPPIPLEDWEEKFLEKWDARLNVRS